MPKTASLSTPRHALSPLPYAPEALAPYISRETLEFHYGKHHRGYVNKLNELVAGSDFESWPLPELVRKATGALFNNAAQVWNHDFYWNCMRPGGVGQPAGELARAIDGQFGSFERFATQFKSSAAGKFGSGWTWLAVRADGSLEIRNGADADNPLRWNLTPLLCCDVWEHAYYIDYRNERAKYLEAFWRLANWDFAGRNFAAR